MLSFSLIAIQFNEIMHLTFQRSLSNTEDECSHLKEMCDASTKELQQLAEKHEEQLNEMRELQQQLSVRTWFMINYLGTNCEMVEITMFYIDLRYNS